MSLLGKSKPYPRDVVQTSEVVMVRSEVDDGGNQQH